MADKSRAVVMAKKSHRRRNMLSPGRPIVGVSSLPARTVVNKSALSRKILRELTGFCDFGSPTQIQSRNGVDYFVNEYWTSKQRKSHRIHEVSYRACFKPQVPAFFIDRLTKPGDIVYDPFMGRGTTLIEAAIKGRIPYGNDINPLSRSLTIPRINTPHLSEIERRLNEIPWARFRSFKNRELLVFYHPKTLAQIEGLRNWFKRRERQGELDLADKWIRMVAINRLTGHSSGFFSVYTMPPNQAVSIERQKKTNERRKQVPPLRQVPDIIIKKSKSLLSQGYISSRENLLLSQSSHNTPQIADECICLTVTSPPFLDIVNYESDNWLRCWFLGLQAKKVPISSHRSIDDWQAFIRKTLRELARITRPGGYIAFEVGEVRNGSIQLEENVIDAASKLPLEVLCVMINQQQFTKTSNCWGVANNSAGTNSNRIVLFEKKS